MPLKNPGLITLLDELKALLAPYAGRFSVREPEPGRYELWSSVNIAPAGKSSHEPYFAGLIVQKSYVGLYFMPVYSDPDIKANLGPEFLKILKGKACFQVKSLTPVLREQIAAALRLGFTTYKNKGWV